MRKKAIACGFQVTGDFACICLKKFLIRPNNRVSLLVEFAHPILLILH